MPAFDFEIPNRLLYRGKNFTGQKTKTFYAKSKYDDNIMKEMKKIAHKIQQIDIINSST